jgi:hypothetical protein
MIALLATIGIDLGLFVLAALNPPKAPPKVNPIGPSVARQVREAMAMAIARGRRCQYGVGPQHSSTTRALLIYHPELVQL